MEKPLKTIVKNGHTYNVYYDRLEKLKVKPRRWVKSNILDIETTFKALRIYLENILENANDITDVELDQRLVHICKLQTELNEILTMVRRTLVRELYKQGYTTGAIKTLCVDYPIENSFNYVLPSYKPPVENIGKSGLEKPGTLDVFPEDEYWDEQDKRSKSEGENVRE